MESVAEKKRAVMITTALLTGFAIAGAALVKGLLTDALLAVEIARTRELLGGEFLLGLRAGELGTCSVPHRRWPAAVEAGEDVAGGGVALLRCQDAVNELKLDGDERVAGVDVDVVITAVESGRA